MGPLAHQIQVSLLPSPWPLLCHQVPELQQEMKVRQDKMDKAGGHQNLRYIHLISREPHEDPLRS